MKGLSRASMLGWSLSATAGCGRKGSLVLISFAAIADPASKFKAAFLHVGKVSAFIFAIGLATYAGTASSCESSLPLKGTESIKTCDPHTHGCTPAAKLVYEYTQAIPDDPKHFTIATQASPWRFYDADMRILLPEELATMIKSHKTPEMEDVVLYASWTGVAPDHAHKSLAQKLSDALDGYPVNGADGFLWMSKDGSLRTTHQAYSMKQGKGPYSAMPGDEVMVSLAAGWPAEVEMEFIAQSNADGVMRAGAGWDIYYLCPERALKSFETAARMSNAIAAYNAALIRLDRNAAGDAEAARVLLKQAAGAGDQKARERLKRLGR